MTFFSGDIRKANAVFLLVLAPIILRLWYEAVVWRLEQGPQMLGFQVLHLSAGGAYAPVLAPVFLFSFLAIYLYLLWVLVLVVMQFIKRAHPGPSNVRLAVVGALSFIAFAYAADYLQTDNLSRELIWGGAFLLTLIVVVDAWLIYSGLIKTIHGTTEHAV
jgi:predicted secreted protein